MGFRGALQSIPKQVLTVNPRLGQVYLGKLDLENTYMSLWVRMEDVQYFTFLITKKTPSNTQLVGLHLSHPMGYIETAPIFAWQRRQ